MIGGATPHFLASVTGTADGFSLALGDAPRPFAHAAMLAGDSRSRRRGLLDRPRLGDDEALVIAPTQGIHTFGMRFPIDVVFVDRLGGVLRVAAGVRPNRVRLCVRAFAAIELAVGRCLAVGVVPGTRIAVRSAT